MKKKEKPQKDKGGNLNDVLKEIQKKFGEDSIMTLFSKPNSDVDAIPTGSIGMNKAIGIGGMPRGRVIEIFGGESSGKTTLALHTIAEAQKLGHICAFVDAEHALDPQYAGKIGVDTKKLLISQPSGGEEALNIVDALVASGKVGVVVVDSVAALVPRSELDGEIGSMQIGAQARLMSQALRILTASVAKTKTVVIFINQTRAKVGGYGDPTTTSGGNALKFYCSVRIQVTKIATIKKGEEQVGIRVKSKVIKNKVASPFLYTEYDILFNEGISREGEILAMGEKLGFIKKSGISYLYGDIKLGVGYEKAREYFRLNAKVGDEIIKKIMESDTTGSGEETSDDETEE